jgi:hypothetical protein
MARRASRLLVPGLIVVATACVSSPPAQRSSCEAAPAAPACQVERLLTDTTLYTAFQRLHAELDSIIAGASAAPGLADTTQLSRILADTTSRMRLEHMIRDTTLYTRLFYLTRELDSVLARSRERDGRRRP